MMNLRRVGKSFVICSACATFMLSAVALTSSPADARPPIGPLCGPDILWKCSGPGGPDVLFGGTVCDRIKFERKSGLTCVPFGG